MTTQMLTQMLLATVSLCVLCETAVRSRPCAQLLPQRATSMRSLMASESELHARAQLSAKSGHFFRVPKKPARAARGARSAPEGRREAPRSGAGCRAAAQSAAAGG